MIKATRTEISHTTDCEGNSISVGDIIEIEKKTIPSTSTYKGLEGKIKRIALYKQGEKTWVMVTFRSPKGITYIDERSSLKKKAPKLYVKPLSVCANNQLSFL